MEGKTSVGTDSSREKVGDRRGYIGKESNGRTEVKPEDSTSKGVMTCGFASRDSSDELGMVWWKS